LLSNTTASNNTAVGYLAGYSNTTGAANTAVGQQALKGNAVGELNTAVGVDSLLVATGSRNTVVGVSAGSQITTGAKNTIIGLYNGNQGGLDIRTASNYIVLSDGDGNPRITVDGSGNVMAVKTAISATAGNGIYVQQSTGQLGTLATNDTVIECNRNGTDGVLINFRHDGTPEGTISVSGTTVSYNGGHLSRWAQTADNTRIDLLKGTVMTNLDQMAVWGDQDNEQLNCMAVSSVEGDPNVAGVFVNWDNDDEEYTADMNIAMTGDMIIRIAQGTTVQRGDLLMSAGDGTAKPQGDDIVRSKTIAKVTSTHVTCTYEDGSYCVPCVLMAC
jgi:hypothetical protein